MRTPCTLPLDPPLICKLSSAICAFTFTNVLADHFSIQFDQHFVQRFLRSRLIAFRLADVKLESSEALKLGENLSWDFEVIYIFRKNAVLDICRCLKGFYVYKKTNNIF